MESEELQTRFMYHPPKGDQQVRYAKLRSQGKRTAIEIENNCPESREKSLAFTKLEEAVMWANASIARRE